MDEDVRQQFFPAASVTKISPQHYQGLAPFVDLHRELAFLDEATLDAAYTGNVELHQHFRFRKGKYQQVTGRPQHQTKVLGLAVEFEGQVVALQGALALKREFAGRVGLYRRQTILFLHCEPI